MLTHIFLIQTIFHLTLGEGNLLPEWLDRKHLTNEIRSLDNVNLNIDLSQCVNYCFEHSSFIEYCTMISKEFIYRNNCINNVSMGCRLSIYYLDRYTNPVSYHNMFRFSKFYNYKRIK